VAAKVKIKSEAKAEPEREGPRHIARQIRASLNCGQPVEHSLRKNPGKSCGKFDKQDL
jgi:hypothetical protein